MLLTLLGAYWTSAPRHRGWTPQDATFLRLVIPKTGMLELNMHRERPPTTLPVMPALITACWMPGTLQGWLRDAHAFLFLP